MQTSPRDFTDTLSMPPSKRRRARAKADRLQLQYSRLKKMERKLDTREKIQLGGLLVKVGLRDEDKDAILGGLVELAKALKNPEERARLTKIGADQFRILKDSSSSSNQTVPEI